MFKCIQGINFLDGNRRFRLKGERIGKLHKNGHFIDRALGGFMAGTAPMLKQGLADLDRRAAALSDGAQRFAGLPFGQQTTLLRDIEDGEFFETVIFLTHCGMFAMPHWGGNRDKAGWKLIGFDDRHAWQPPFGHYDAQAAARGVDHDA